MMQNLYNSKNHIRENDIGDFRKNNVKIPLRNHHHAFLNKSRTNASIKGVDHHKDKQIINTGLHKLLSSFNNSPSTKNVTQRSSKTAYQAAYQEQIDTTPRYSRHSTNIQTSQSARELTDRQTMTEFQQIEKPVEWEETNLVDHRAYRDMQWTDPRLLRKYSSIKQPFKKSMTIPCVTKPSAAETATVEDHFSEEEEAEILYSENKHIVFRCLYYFCTASVSFIGSMCGITLITVILWKILDENLIEIHFETPKNELFLRRLVRAVGNVFIDAISSIFGKITRILTISTSEVFEPNEELPAWYQNYIKQ